MPSRIRIVQPKVSTAPRLSVPERRLLPIPQGTKTGALAKGFNTLAEFIGDELQTFQKGRDLTVRTKLIKDDQEKRERFKAQKLKVGHAGEWLESAKEYNLKIRKTSDAIAQQQLSREAYDLYTSQQDIAEVDFMRQILRDGRDAMDVEVRNTLTSLGKAAVRDLGNLSPQKRKPSWDAYVKEVTGALGLRVEGKHQLQARVNATKARIENEFGEYKLLTAPEELLDEANAKLWFTQSLKLEAFKTRAKAAVAANEAEALRQSKARQGLVKQQIVDFRSVVKGINPLSSDRDIAELRLRAASLSKLVAPFETFDDQSTLWKDLQNADIDASLDYLAAITDMRGKTLPQIRDIAHRFTANTRAAVASGIIGAGRRTEFGGRLVSIIEKMENEAERAGETLKGQERRVTQINLEGEANSFVHAARRMLTDPSVSKDDVDQLVANAALFKGRLLAFKRLYSDDLTAIQFVRALEQQVVEAEKFAAGVLGVSHLDEGDVTISPDDHQRVAISQLRLLQDRLGVGDEGKKFIPLSSTSEAIHAAFGKTIDAQIERFKAEISSRDAKTETQRRGHQTALIAEMERNVVDLNATVASASGIGANEQIKAKLEDLLENFTDDFISYMAQATDAEKPIAVRKFNSLKVAIQVNSFLASLEGAITPELKSALEVWTRSKSNPGPLMEFIKASRTGAAADPDEIEGRRPRGQFSTLEEVVSNLNDVARGNGINAAKLKWAPIIARHVEALQQAIVDNATYKRAIQGDESISHPDLDRVMDDKIWGRVIHSSGATEWERTKIALYDADTGKLGAGAPVLIVYNRDTGGHLPPQAYRHFDSVVTNTDESRDIERAQIIAMAHMMIENNIGMKSKFSEAVQTAVSVFAPSMDPQAMGALIREMQVRRKEGKTVNIQSIRADAVARLDAPADALADHIDGATVYDTRLNLPIFGGIFNEGGLIPEGRRTILGEDKRQQLLDQYDTIRLALLETGKYDDFIFVRNAVNAAAAKQLVETWGISTVATPDGDQVLVFKPVDHIKSGYGGPKAARRITNELLDFLSGPTLTVTEFIPEVAIRKAKKEGRAARENTILGALNTAAGFIMSPFDTNRAEALEHIRLKFANRYNPQGLPAYNIRVGGRQVLMDGVPVVWWPTTEAEVNKVSEEKVARFKQKYVAPFVNATSSAYRDIVHGMFTGAALEFPRGQESDPFAGSDRRLLERYWPKPDPMYPERR